MLDRIRALGVVAGGVAGLLMIACVPIFSGGLFPSLSLSFRFDNALPAGEQTLVHTAVFPESVKVKKNFVQIAGRLADGGNLPGSVKLEAEFADVATGNLSQRLSVKLTIRADGSFKGNAKIKKNIEANQMMSVTLEPSGGPIPDGTAVTLCVDLVKKKGDLKKLPACGGGGPNSLSALQADFFTPTCARGGCHDALTSPAGLVLEEGESFGNLVNVPSRQRPELNRVTPRNPDDSYLIRKLRGQDIDGQQMPDGGPFLTNAEIARFVAWINDGAPNN